MAAAKVSHVLLKFLGQLYALHKNSVFLILQNVNVSTFLMEQRWWIESGMQRLQTKQIIWWFNTRIWLCLQLFIRTGISFISPKYFTNFKVTAVVQNHFEHSHKHTTHHLRDDYQIDRSYTKYLITVINCTLWTILILHIFQAARRNTTVHMHDFYLPNDPFQDPYVGR